ncbi:hypothetical protein pEaSNUABM11_00083 [Erwinia phage pEa_SNUABM_11]|nr:hypothetical protein pEaSNUABM11_00083 [Erwinia phage pEa_SNUABM_11]
MTRNVKKVIIATVLSFLLVSAYVVLNNDYNTCRANGNSDAMCTGRG